MCRQSRSSTALASNSDLAAVEIAVVGSINLDISIPVRDLPLPGETVLGGDALWSPGGKGANQAVGAARLGRSVAMVGCVGDDAAGDQLLAALVSDRISIVAVRRLIDVPTGLATIAVSDAGENSIVVSPGANARLDAAHVTEWIDRLSPRAVLTQFEVPPEAVAAIAGRAGLLVVNPAPARQLDPEVLAAIDVLVPNKGELAVLASSSVAETIDEVADQARALGVARVVVTLGGEGALVVDRAGSPSVVHVPIVPVAVVDTTAAGDSFCAALVDALLDDANLVDATRWAARVAAVTVGRRGAQQSLPKRSEVR